MNARELSESAAAGGSPPPGLSRELESLWLLRAGRWDAAHEVAQDIHTATGSWIHGLLHLIEGDIPNARYWYARAGRSSLFPDDADREWLRIAEHVLGSGQR